MIRTLLSLFPESSAPSKPRGPSKIGYLLKGKILQGSVSFTLISGIPHSALAEKAAAPKKSTSTTMTADSMEIENSKGKSTSTRLLQVPGQLDLESLILKTEKARARKVIIDPGVRGSIVVYDSLPQTPEHLYRELLIALATNGFTIVEQGDTDVVMAARNAERAGIPVLESLPSESEEKLVTWSVHLKNIDGDSVLKYLRVLASKDGSMSTTPDPHTVIFSDYVSSLYHSKQILDFIEGNKNPAIDQAHASAENVVKDGETKVNFDFKSVDLTKLMQTLSPMLNKTVILDPSVRGRITLQNPGPISRTEAYRAAVTALQINGFSVTVQGEFLRVHSTRNVSRMNIDVFSKMPDVLENRMITYMLRVPKGAPDVINRMMRSLASRDGEMVICENPPLLIIVDSMPNVKQIVETVAQGKFDVSIEKSTNGSSD